MTVQTPFMPAAPPPVRVTKRIEFDAGHRVPSHDGQCRNPHGHRYAVELTMAGPVQATGSGAAEGMVIDFGDIKRFLTEQVHDLFDHGFMCHALDHDLIVALRTLDPDWKVIVLSFPPTAENLATFIGHEASYVLDHDDVFVESVAVWETPSSRAEWRAS